MEKYVITTQTLTQISDWLGRKRAKFITCSHSTVHLWQLSTVPVCDYSTHQPAAHSAVFIEITGLGNTGIMIMLLNILYKHSNKIPQCLRLHVFTRRKPRRRNEVIKITGARLLAACCERMLNHLQFKSLIWRRTLWVTLQREIWESYQASWRSALDLFTVCKDWKHCCLNKQHWE